MSAGNDRSARSPADGLATRVVLPDWHELFAALCGHVADDPHAHPVTRCARRLAELHAAHEREPGIVDLASARRVLIVGIDEWVACHAPHASRCGESLGNAADRLAQTQRKAIAALRTDTDPEHVHAAWHALSVLATEWADLVDEVMHGQRRIEAGHGPDARKAL
ncbi:hypothetical protein [Nocardia aurantiaca]|uniref:DUF4254 domain-containing protein n=1 Tax=Nocardia aurantiaca TaxID=2675850 RepID=A0A6I3KY54_9NOCA|nr:hypothetical protein [Nocardia aurantiaca]MTE14331.1 hypothetical protein [Nocardia aurantiaca]